MWAAWLLADVHLGCVGLATEFQSTSSSGSWGLGLKKSHLRYKELETRWGLELCKLKRVWNGRGCLVKVPLSSKVEGAQGARKRLVLGLKPCTHVLRGSEHRIRPSSVLHQGGLAERVSSLESCREQDNGCLKPLNSIQKYLYSSSKHKGLGCAQTLSCTQQKTKPSVACY